MTLTQKSPTVCCSYCCCITNHPSNEIKITTYYSHRFCDQAFQQGSGMALEPHDIWKGESAATGWPLTCLVVDLAVGWNLRWGCWLENPRVAFPCDLGFLTAWKLLTWKLCSKSEFPREQGRSCTAFLI